MEVVVETPKGSLIKYSLRGDTLKKEYASPLPNLFNYGFIPGTKAADGMEKDAIILGPKLRTGEKVKVNDVGVVRFMDDGLVDDKIVTSLDGRIGFFDKNRIHLFFTVYMLFKSLRYLVHERRLAKCGYLGLTLKCA